MHGGGCDRNANRKRKKESLYYSLGLLTFLHNRSVPRPCNLNNFRASRNNGKKKLKIYDFFSQKQQKRIFKKGKDFMHFFMRQRAIVCPAKRAFWTKKFSLNSHPFTVIIMYLREKLGLGISVHCFSPTTTDWQTGDPGIQHSTHRAIKISLASISL